MPLSREWPPIPMSKRGLFSLVLTGFGGGGGTHKNGNTGPVGLSIGAGLMNGSVKWVKTRCGIGLSAVALCSK